MITINKTLKIKNSIWFLYCFSKWSSNFCCLHLFLCLGLFMLSVYIYNLLWGCESAFIIFHLQMQVIPLFLSRESFVPPIRVTLPCHHSLNFRYELQVRATLHRLAQSSSCALHRLCHLDLFSNEKRKVESDNPRFWALKELSTLSPVPPTMRLRTESLLQRCRHNKPDDEIFWKGVALQKTLSIKVYANAYDIKTFFRINWKGNTPLTITSELRVKIILTA